MNEQVKINSLQIENVKRVKALTLEPSPNGLTIIGGKNRQGKTSVLDAIAWALGGNKYKPSEPQREGSVLPPTLFIKLSNGLIVERKGKNSDLRVTDPEGGRSGQALLDSFVEELAINLPKFMQSTSKEKAQTLLQIIGVGDQLFELESREIELYNKRHAIGQIADQKDKFAKEQIYYEEAPDEYISASELIKEQQEILARNGENQRKRDHLQKMIREETIISKEIIRLMDDIQRLQKDLEKTEATKNALAVDIQMAKKTIEKLQDESTAELEKSLEDIEAINVKVRANIDKKKAEADAKTYKDQYTELTAEIEDIRKAKIALLDSADLPLEGLSVEEGELTYQNFKWDNLSGSDQLKIATAIVRKLNPKCGFVLLDKLEQMDIDTLRDFGQWLETEGLQAIATRVSTGEECQIIIEDGYGIEPIPTLRKYEKGVF